MRKIGMKGETYAAALLKRQGYTIIERNFTVRGGEIDIIAKDRDTLVFVEVKLRKTTAFGRPASYVDWRKQEKLIYTAKCYLHQKNMDVPCRFDVVELIGETGAFGRLKVSEANIVKNAFSC